MDAAAQYALAYTLTTGAGLRGLLCLAVVSVVAHFGWMHPPQAFAWLGSTTAMVVLVAVAIADFIGDKIPVVDNALHVVHVVVKPAAAVILVGGSVHGHSNAELVTLMAVGAFNALGIHAASAAVRGTSTATTGGIANPFVSLFEDAIAALMLVLAFVAPLVAAALAIVLTIFIVRMAFVAWRSTHAAA
jgi:uncharacterized membrane protein